MLYRMLVRLIESNQTEGLKDKLDLFQKAGKLSKEEYEELILMLGTE